MTISLRASLVLLAIPWAIPATSAAEEQGMKVDISALAPNLEPDFTIGRTGEGEAAEWEVIRMFASSAWSEASTSSWPAPTQHLEREAP